MKSLFVVFNLTVDGEPAHWMRVPVGGRGRLEPVCNVPTGPVTRPRETKRRRAKGLILKCQRCQQLLKEYTEKKESESGEGQQEFPTAAPAREGGESNNDDPSFYGDYTDLL